MELNRRDQESGYRLSTGLTSAHASEHRHDRIGLAPAIGGEGIVRQFDSPSRTELQGESGMRRVVRTGVSPMLSGSD